jgi:hypothetical protein
MEYILSLTVTWNRFGMYVFVDGSGEMTGQQNAYHNHNYQKIEE